MNRWNSTVAIVLALTACDGGNSGTDGGTEPGMDGGTQPGADGGGPAVVGECTQVCDADDDCADRLACVERRCACSSDERCQIGDTWSEEGCTSDTECTGFMARCAQWGSTTFCLPDRSTSFDCGIGASERLVEVTLADGSGTIRTCVNTRIECLDDGTCAEPSSGCEDDGDCNASSNPQCDVPTGRCVCTTDSCTRGTQCRADGECGCAEDSACPGELRCDVENARCVCADDTSCSGGEVCHEGQCRCTVANGCGVFVSPTNPGTTLECIPL